jgi:hypothetical protein
MMIEDTYEWLPEPIIVPRPVPLDNWQADPFVIAAKERELEEQQALQDYTRHIRKQLREAADRG